MGREKIGFNDRQTGFQPVMRAIRPGEFYCGRVNLDKGDARIRHPGRKCEPCATNARTGIDNQTRKS